MLPVEMKIPGGEKGLCHKHTEGCWRARPRCPSYVHCLPGWGSGVLFIFGLTQSYFICVGSKINNQEGLLPRKSRKRFFFEEVEISQKLCHRVSEWTFLPPSLDMINNMVDVLGKRENKTKVSFYIISCMSQNSRVSNQLKLNPSRVKTSLSWEERRSS